MRHPVLVLGAAPRIALPIARSLRRNRLPVMIVTASSREPRLHSAAIEECWRIPDAEEEPDEFLRALRELIDRWRPDLLVPTNDTALAAVTRHYYELAGKLAIACPPPPIVNQVLDKGLTLDLGCKCQIAVPETLRVDNASGLEEAARKLNFPLIAKPQTKYRESSLKVTRFNSLAELHAFVSRHKGLPPMLLQRLVAGEGIGIELLRHGGHCIATFQHRRRKEFPYSGGVSVVAVSEAPDAALVEQARRLLDALEWEGVAMVEFKVDPESGRAVLMEVNGRFWGTIALPVQAGIDFPLYVWQIAHGETPRVPPHYEVGACWRWSAGYVRRLHGVAAGAVKPGAKGARLRDDLWHSGADFAPSVRDALWTASDPLPAIQEMAQALGEIARSDLRWLRTRLFPVRSDPSPGSGGQPGRRERAARVFMGLLRASRLRDGRIPRKARKIVFVCHGNIMRSPMCEQLFLKGIGEGASGFQVISAGLNAVPGKGADPRAVKVAFEFGISLAGHQARPVTGEMLEQADIVFAMDFRNEAQLLARHPDMWRKVRLLGACALDSQKREIPDPYWGDEAEVRRCYQELDQCIRNLVKAFW